MQKSKGTKRWHSVPRSEIADPESNCGCLLPKDRQVCPREEGKASAGGKHASACLIFGAANSFVLSLHWLSDEGSAIDQHLTVCACCRPQDLQPDTTSIPTAAHCPQVPRRHLNGHRCNLSKPRTTPGHNDCLIFDAANSLVVFTFICSLMAMST